MIVGTTVALSACGGDGESPPVSGTADPTGLFAVLTGATAGLAIDAPGVDTLFACESSEPEIVAVDTPWYDPDTGEIDMANAVTVPGEIVRDSELSVSVEGNARNFGGNGLPEYPTRDFPPGPDTAAFEYASELQPVEAQQISLELPQHPSLADDPTCLGRDPIGLMLSGAVLYKAARDDGQVLVAVDSMDLCQGHTRTSDGWYHHHSPSACWDYGPAAGHSAPVGYAIDGFGIYGPFDQGGGGVGNDELDECHGHTHEVDWDGEPTRIYHYHANSEFPFVIGCLRGEISAIDNASVTDEV